MRAVLAVDRLGMTDPVTGAELMVIKVVRAPWEVPQGASPLKLSPDALPGWETPDAVRERGKLVRLSLKAHPGVAKLLDRLEETPLDQVQPLYVQMTEGEAEQICWETLCDSKDKFVALDPRWPIGRISDPLGGQTRPPAVLRLPIRIMVVISAFKVGGQQLEWELFRASAAKARANGLDVRLKFLVAETTLRAAIDAAIAGGLDWIEVGSIEKTASRVIQDIVEWKPQMLHFFCHGISEDADQWLELATASDYLDPDATVGSVKLRPPHLTPLAQLLPEPWLLTLNCCSSGRAAKELQSMAHQVVTAGFASAIAMLEPVDAKDAHEFTRSFYASLFDSLRRVSQKLAVESRVAFEWVEPMSAARTALLDLHDAEDAANCRQWALPVLYVRGIDPFFFARPVAASTDQADHKLKVGIVAQWLSSVRDEMSEEQRADVMQSVLADVPKSLWPSVDGSFGGV